MQFVVGRQWSPPVMDTRGSVKTAVTGQIGVGSGKRQAGHSLVRVVLSAPPRQTQHSPVRLFGDGVIISTESPPKRHRKGSSDEIEHRRKSLNLLDSASQ